MCIIVHREAGTSHIPDAVIAHHRRVNPDGFGLAWRDEKGELLHRKFAPDDFTPFAELLKTIDSDIDVEYVAHFRTATHGPKCEEMSHPFEYADKKDGKVLVFHNGVIPIHTPSNVSDTFQFVRAILSHMEPRWWMKAAYRYLVEESVGYSRLIVMTAKETIRLNQSAWVEREGIWYSTTPLPSYSTTPYQSKAPSAAASTSTEGAQKWDPKGSNWTKGGDGFWHKGSDEGSQPDEPSVVNDSALGNEAIDTTAGWYQSGHYIYALTEVVEKGDLYGTACCSVCHTIGDYYQIEGQTYIDIRHDDWVDDTDEEDEATLKGVMLA